MDNFNLKMPNGLEYNCQMKDQNISCTVSNKQNFSSTEIITDTYKSKIKSKSSFGMHHTMSMHGMDMPCMNCQKNRPCMNCQKNRPFVAQNGNCHPECRHPDCPYRRGLNKSKKLYLSGGKWEATGELIMNKQKTHFY